MKENAPLHRDTIFPTAFHFHNNFLPVIFIMLRAKLIRVVLLIVLLLAGPNGAWARKPGIVAPDANAIAAQSVSKADTLFIILSGDGGWWGDIEAQTGKALGGRGYAVVGMDTNKWFRDQRSPEELGAWLGYAIRHYGDMTGARRIMLVGWSFGANILPIGVNSLDPALRQRVSAVVALAPEQRARLVVTIAGRMGIVGGDIDLAPELVRMKEWLPKGRFFCVDGAGEDEESGCRLSAADFAVKAIWPGGHSFDHDTDMVTNALVTLLKPVLVDPIAAP